MEHLQVFWRIGRITATPRETREKFASHWEGCRGDREHVSRADYKVRFFLRFAPECHI